MEGYIILMHFWDTHCLCQNLEPFEKGGHCSTHSMIVLDNFRVLTTFIDQKKKKCNQRNISVSSLVRDKGKYREMLRAAPEISRHCVKNLGQTRP